MLTEDDKDVLGFVGGDFFEVGSDKGLDRSSVPVGINRLRLVEGLQHVQQRTDVQLTKNLKTVLDGRSGSDRARYYTPTRAGLRHCHCLATPHASPRWRATDDVTIQESCAIAEMTALCADKCKQIATPPPKIT